MWMVRSDGGGTPGLYDVDGGMKGGGGDPVLYDVDRWTDRGGGDPRLYDVHGRIRQRRRGPRALRWLEGPSPASSEEEGLPGGRSPHRFPLVRRAGTQAGAGVTRLLPPVPLVPLQKPQGGRASEGSPVWGATSRLWGCIDVNDHLCPLQTAGQMPPW